MDGIIEGSALFYYMFLMTTLTLSTLILSIISASFGLAKGLKTGVAGIFKSGGVFDGFQSFPFYTICTGRGQNDFKNKSLNMEFSICGQMWSFLMGLKRTQIRKTFTLTLASCCCLLSKATLINVLEEHEVMK